MRSTSSDPAATDPEPGSSSALRGLRFALLAHPTVQAVRFLSKALLAWFLATEELGEAAFAGLIVFGVAHVAIFGLDDALVHAPVLDRTLWRRMRRTQMLLGAGLAAATALAGWIVGGRFESHPLLGWLLLALSPTLLVGNLAVLPSALLVRERDLRAVFLVDVAQVLALSITTLALAAAGLGPGALVGGWYANSLAAWAASTVLARRHLPREEHTGSAEWRATRSFGSHLVGAALFSYLVERLDGFAIGARLGRAALGVWELALHLSQAGLSYTASLVDRLIFPTLSKEHRAARLVPALLDVLRFAFLVLIPLHAALSVCAAPLVRALFPPAWQGSAPLFAALALAAGARSLELVLVAALKASGRGRAVLGLAWMRLFLLAGALAIALPRGLEAVAIGVLAARAVAALASFAVVLRVFGNELLRTPGAFANPIGIAATWCTALVVLAGAARPLEADRPLVFVAGVVLGALASWVLLRVLFDRASFAREIAWLRRELPLPAPLAQEGGG